MYDTASYFSESQKQFIQVADMPMPYARNVFAKLMRDKRNEFEGTVLQKALYDRLCPSRTVAKTLLATKGECSYYVPAGTVKGIRSWFYRIGKELGVKVHTEVKPDSDFMLATCEPVGEEVIVNILHKKDPSKTFIGKGR